MDLASLDADGETAVYTMAWTVDGVDYIAGSADSGLDSGTPDFIGPSTTVWPDDTVLGEDVGPSET
ncbi:MAG TPA: hypothetical protein DFR83_10285, partial [Deltaproteobacteria bacterium]|nr:hypothetical protein [Deltaproteobacteria bacterium]